MKKQDLASSNYNYYPNAMINLCVISYAEDINDIPAQVAAMGLQVVWGPAQWVDEFGVSYSLMYVAMNPATGEYTVVIRGTNPTSLATWLDQDFDVAFTQPFKLLVPSAPSNALISQGTYNGMNDLISLTDPVTNELLTTFLGNLNPRTLYVTGHSLGGTLVPTMELYLNSFLYGGGYLHNMASWSFAGLASGNVAFANYYNSLSNPEFPWRIHNPLDIAPFCFWSESSLQNIYNSYGLPWSSLDFILRGIVDGLFLVASPNNYAQPVGDQVLPAQFNTGESGWAEQAFYQHHATTYQALVALQYPIS